MEDLSFSTIGKHTLVAAIVVMIIVLIGHFARALYIVIVRPRKGWVIPVHESTFSLALGLGLAAAATEAIFMISGLRARHCRDYGDSRYMRGV